MAGATTDKHAMKGMNMANKVTKTLGAKHRGQVTDGADMSKGYKVVHAEGHSPTAYSIHNKSHNNTHHRG